mmetsp:Transcript_4682/g.6147  ORF Transcript_4682/g.6147 Transcript_4682/m.6147 type:complete len:285 (+) Transcript_4682:29-883(+)
MARIRGIDYSKWDNFGDSEDESESGDRDDANLTVTKLGYPSQITINPENEGQNWSVYDNEGSKMDAKFNFGGTERVQGGNDQQKTKTKKRPSPRYCMEDLSENGGWQPVVPSRMSGEQSKPTEDGVAAYFWSQNRSEVVVHVGVPPNTRAPKVHVSLTGGKDLYVGLEGQPDAIISGTLSYDVIIEDEEEGSGAIDWELVDLAEEGGMRAVKITFKKKVPQQVQGLVTTIWWKNVIEGHLETDIARIKGRNSTTAAKHADAWHQAQEMFREKMKQKTKISVDLT